MEKNNELMTTANPQDLIKLAIENKGSIEQLEKLMALQERWEDRQAKKSFLTAMAEFQSICPELKKGKLVSFLTSKGVVNYKYAPLGEITATIKDALKKVGLSFRWENTQKDNNIEISCIISHSAGHSERTSMSAGKDVTGSKNEIQQRGSTITYLQRYTLIGVLGISTADEDNDGRSSDKNEPSSPKATTEKKDKDDNKTWLNKYVDQEHTIVNGRYTEIIKGAKEKNMDLKELRKYYKISKDVAVIVEADLKSLPKKEKKSPDDVKKEDPKISETPFQKTVKKELDDCKNTDECKKIFAKYPNEHASSWFQDIYFTKYNSFPK